MAKLKAVESFELLEVSARCHALNSRVNMFTRQILMAVAPGGGMSTILALSSSRSHVKHESYCFRRVPLVAKAIKKRVFFGLLEWWFWPSYATILMILIKKKKVTQWARLSTNRDRMTNGHLVLQIIGLDLLGYTRDRSIASEPIHLSAFSCKLEICR